MRRRPRRFGAAGRIVIPAALAVAAAAALVFTLTRHPGATSDSYWAGWEAGTIVATAQTGTVHVDALCAADADTEETQESGHLVNGRAFSIGPGALDKVAFVKGCLAAYTKWNPSDGTPVTPTTNNATTNDSAPTADPTAGLPGWNRTAEAGNSTDIAALAQFLRSHVGRVVSLDITWTGVTAEDLETFIHPTALVFTTGFVAPDVCGASSPCSGGLSLVVPRPAGYQLLRGGRVLGAFMVESGSMSQVGSQYEVTLSPATPAPMTNSTTTGSTPAAPACGVPVSDNTWTDYTYDPTWNQYQKLLWDAGMTLSKTYDMLNGSAAPTLDQVNQVSTAMCLPARMRYENQSLPGTRSWSDCFTGPQTWLWVAVDHSHRYPGGEINAVFYGRGGCPQAQTSLGLLHAVDLKYSNPNYTMNHTAYPVHPDIGVAYAGFDQVITDYGNGESFGSSGPVDDLLVSQFDDVFYCGTCPTQ